MNCRRCVHLCLSELTLPRPGHPPALVGPKTRAFRGGAPGAYEGHARSPLAALPPLRWPRWIIGCGSRVRPRRQGCGIDSPALYRQTHPNAFLLRNVEPSAGQDPQERCARELARPLVAVHERMIPDDDLHQRRSLGVMGRVPRLVIENQEGPVYGYSRRALSRTPDIPPPIRTARWFRVIRSSTVSGRGASLNAWLIP
jgi:hypothetical protein